MVHSALISGNDVLVPDKEAIKNLVKSFNNS